MKKSFFLLATLVCLCHGSFCQQPVLTAHPSTGTCMVQGITPEEYEVIENRILVRPAHKRLEIVPAEFQIIEEKVLVKPATKKYVYVPAEFQTVTEEIQVEDASSEITVEPPKFDVRSELLQVRPQSGRWEYKNLENCQSPDPRECMILQYVEYPPEFKNISTETLAQPATFSKTLKPGKRMAIQKQVIVKEATVQEIEIPAEYISVARRVLVRDEEVREIEVPAEYRVETVQVLKDKGGVPVWEEVDCKLTDYNLLPIFFATGSAQLDLDAQRIVDDRLLQLMREKLNIRVELASHTDSRGDAADNERLSQARAESVTEYLVSKGIPRSRIVAKGFGETRLKNRCRDGVVCNETEHAQNRRIEFRVLNR